MSKIQIICRLSNDFILGLADVRENIGHDDSLPFQAEIHICDRQKYPAKEPGKLMTFHKIGTVCNDGWGGVNEIRALWDDVRRPEYQAYLRQANEMCSHHSIFHEGKPLGKYSLDYLCSVLAESVIYLDEQYRGKLVEYHFDDDPVVLATDHHSNLYCLSS